MFATTWATGQIFLITMAFFLWLLWLWLIVRISIDVFSDRKMSGPMKALWIAVLLLFPFVSVIAYLVTRGSDSIRGPMHAMSPSDAAIQKQMRAAH